MSIPRRDARQPYASKRPGGTANRPRRRFRPCLIPQALARRERPMTTVARGGEIETARWFGPGADRLDASSTGTCCQPPPPSQRPVALREAAGGTRSRRPPGDETRIGGRDSRNDDDEEGKGEDLRVFPHVLSLGRSVRRPDQLTPNWRARSRYRRLRRSFPGTEQRFRESPDSVADQASELSRRIRC